MLDGKQSIVEASKLEDKLLENVWYKAELVAQKGIFRVKVVKDDPKGDGINSAPEVLVADNSFLRSGAFAFTMDNVKGSYFSDIEIDPLDCTTPDYDELEVLNNLNPPNFTSRFYD